MADRDGTADHGFTLVEMIVVVAMIALIAGVLGLAATTFIRNEGSVSSRITETRWLQNLANFLPRDVGSARSIESTPSTPANACGTGGVILLHLEWAEEWAGDTYTNRVTYREFAAPPRRVSRFSCENGAAPVETTLIELYDTVSIAIEYEPPPDDTQPTGTVTAVIAAPDGSRRITATSRNFVPPTP